MLRSLIVAVFVFALLSQTYAEEAGKKDKAVNEQGKSVVDLMASMWSKISKVGKKKQSTVPVAVAGLRGAEQEKENDLEPYWKGSNKDRDRAAISEVEGLVNKKDYNGAVEQLSKFDASYPESALKPVAKMMLGICYSQAGKTNEALLVFEDFLKRYPGHELASEAKSAVESLKADKTG